MTARLSNQRLARAIVPTALCGCLLAVVLVACDGDAAGPGLGVNLVHGTPSPSAPHLTATICLDRTPSYPRGDLDGAKGVVADAIIKRAVPAQQGATVYVTLIGPNSYAPEATVQTITLDAVPPYPVLPPETSPTQGNIFNQHATATAQASATLAAYAPTVSAQQAQLRNVQSQANSQAATLRQLNPQTAGPTDIYGCLSRAADRFRGADGDNKVLVIASDMSQEGSQQSCSSCSLSDVKVKVIFFECTQAQTCEARKSNWTQTLKDLQAADVQFYDPGAPRAAEVDALFS